MDNFTQERIMRYLDKEMSADELEQFESELDSNPALREEFSSLQTAREAVMLYGIRQSIRKIHEEEMANKASAAKVVPLNPYRRLIKIGLAAAASVVLILVAINSLLSGGNTAEGLYNSQYVRYESVTARGASDTVSSLTQKYEAKEFSAVTSMFDPSLPPNEQLMAGVSYLETDQPERAKAVFESILAKNKNAGLKPFNDEAEFYLALTQLRLKAYDAAAALMQKIKGNSDHKYHKSFSTEFIQDVKDLKK